MAPPPAAAISVRDTLDLLDDTFASFAEGVANGRYAFWLGSGISLGVVPGLWGVVGRVVEFLRANRNPVDPTCRFNRAFQDALLLAGVNADQAAALDLTISFETWPKSTREPIVAALLRNYSKLLAIRVGTEPFDYLVWDVVKVPETYAAAALMPDVEHLCLAALSLEGIATDMVSANWDPLVERAIAFLTDGNAALAATVVAKPDVKWGETPVAYVELRPGSEVSAADLVAHCKGLLAGYKVPREIRFEEIPKTSTGKIQKFQLRERAKSASAIE